MKLKNLTFTIGKEELLHRNSCSYQQKSSIRNSKACGDSEATLIGLGNLVAFVK